MFIKLHRDGVPANVNVDYVVVTAPHPDGKRCHVVYHDDDYATFDESFETVSQLLSSSHGVVTTDWLAKHATPLAEEDLSSDMQD